MKDRAPVCPIFGPFEIQDKKRSELMKVQSRVYSIAFP
jgi:hypothetical protein